MPIWAIDFDGTLELGKWPNIGAPNYMLIETLKLARMKGVRLILWTHRFGEALNEATDWCKEQGLEFDAINTNLPETIELYKCDTRKVIADLYIDDKSFPPSKRDSLCNMISTL